MKQIKIEQLLPLLKSGWVAYDNGGWWWFSAKPRGRKRNCIWVSTNRTFIKLQTFEMRDIAPFDGDWKDSLIKVEHKEEE